MKTSLHIPTRFTIFTISTVFLLTSVLCSEHIPDCQTEHFDENNQEWICDQCDPGFTQGIGDTDCYPCPPGCSTCNFFDECQSCFPAFYLDTSTPQCLPCMDGCSLCNGGGDCVKCISIAQFPYTSTQGTNCVSCGLNCTECNTDKTFSCKTCEAGFNPTEKSGGGFYCQKPASETLDVFSLLILIVFGCLLLLTVVGYFLASTKKKQTMQLQSLLPQERPVIPDSPQIISPDKAEEAKAKSAKSQLIEEELK